MSAFAPVLLTGGLRHSDAFPLRWGDIDLTTGVVRVVRGLTRLAIHGAHARSFVIADPKTESARRAVPLPTAARRRLAHHRMQVEMRLRVGSAWEDVGLVFTNELGRPVDLDIFADATSRAC